MTESKFVENGKVGAEMRSQSTTASRQGIIDAEIEVHVSRERSPRAVPSELRVQRLGTCAVVRTIVGLG